MKVDRVEDARIGEIIDAAVKADWPAFKALTDEEFLNEDAMNELFVMCATELQAMSQITVKPFAKKLPDGRGKGIYCQIVDEAGSERTITLILHSVKVESRHTISILVFAPPTTW